ncbi:hypothetical protein CC85DRAFT_103115 [Cutaneotrichosporon oleaginosum]|uniref:GAR domain-containing protein n=1 Tax=Cutaneotrichosporon oleaginosum TaxID=879819 RepID=A0A0J1B2X6_9TREE|nr:uncharacterized protein CC85DRAFT_103115 [Cutaneotrichosporon oleaginosum]KLT41954.1 hypothetical protein CC85DRAFT_103115 [Cutaneotrichosporon oleaginosum]TXT12553.1 hypothetical protein COLE_02963 [Cutaneotrichosporon oleaginosum]
MTTALELSPRIAELATDFVDLRLSQPDLAEDQDRRRLDSTTPTASMTSSPAAPASLPVMPEHSREASSSSASTGLHSDESPPRPSRSALRKARGANLTVLLHEAENLHSEVATLLDKIYEIEELRHSPSARSGHATRLDGLLSELNDSIQALSQRMTTFEVAPESDPSGMLGPLRADWAKVLSQHAQLKQELQEDPWLVRFRTTADQAQDMMDPLQNSLLEVTSYVGRILSSLAPVPMSAPEGKLSIERLRRLVAGHARLKVAYVPSVIKILRIMDKSVSERAVKNGEALRRVADMQQRWVMLQRQLSHLDDKVRLVLSQNDPDHPHFEDNVELLEDDRSHHTSPLHSPPLFQSDTPPHYSLQRVLSAGSAIPDARQSLAPPSVPRTGSITPNAQRSVRRIQSRPSLPVASPLDRPRWNASTRPFEPPPTPPALRRPSQGSQNSLGMSASAIGRRPSQASIGSAFGTQSLRRAGSPTFSSPPGSTAPRMPHTAPRKNIPSTPTRPRAMGRQSFGGSLGRPPPSAFRVISPAPSMPHRPSSRVSIASAASSHIPAAGKLFTPSKYDLLDQEVQKVIDEVQPNILITRLDQPLRRGQRKAEGESWTGEFVFGGGERSSSVKLLELPGRGPPGAPKRVKVMVRVGGAWGDLKVHLQKKKEDAVSIATS